MTRHTVDLSPAKSYSRRKRAGKAVSVLRQRVESMVDGEYRIQEEVNHHIWDQGAENPPRSIEIDIDRSSEPAVISLTDSEPGSTTVQETEDQAEDSGEDYAEVLDGTVSEAKDAVQEMEDPDYGRLLEIERENKDRKTLKEWLESRA